MSKDTSNLAQGYNNFEHHEIAEKAWALVVKRVRFFLLPSALILAFAGWGTWSLRQSTESIKGIETNIKSIEENIKSAEEATSAQVVRVKKLADEAEAQMPDVAALNDASERQKSEFNRLLDAHKSLNMALLQLAEVSNDPELRTSLEAAQEAMETLQKEVNLFFCKLGNVHEGKSGDLSWTEELFASEGGWDDVGPPKEGDIIRANTDVYIREGFPVRRDTGLYLRPVRGVIKEGSTLVVRSVKPHKVRDETHYWISFSPDSLTEPDPETHE
ncbi:hypothetical protein HZ994_02285 [Akkermansiaceae bacterium]|nr:hypothetical protein HZ994_02285 [Akkermansiaceae bacterium]